MNFRKILFWTHLIVGVAAGLIIAVMSLTGVALAFEKELVAWSERDARRVPAPPAATTRLPVEDLLRRVKEQHPGGGPSSVTVHADVTLATVVGYGRTNTYYVDPYSGQIRQPGSRQMRDFMQIMIAWHRWLSLEGQRRDLGKAITGASNVAFLGLALSGLYLWWPRHWTAKHLRAIALPSLQGRGKARDWNWHNAFGFWAAPVLIVLTITAIPISYRWGGTLIYTLTGTPPPTGGIASGPASGPAVNVPPPAPGARPLSVDRLLESAQMQVPRWEQMTVRFGGGAGRGPGSRESRAGGLPGEPRREREANEAGRSGPPTGDGAAVAPAPNPVTISVKEIDGRPRFFSQQLSLDPFTGAILRHERYADLDRARQVRSWTRFLHTGEALGPVGQAAAGLASLVAGVLVWTGLALTWRRFVRRRSSATVPIPAPGEVTS